MDGQTQPGQAYPAGFPETLSVGGIDEVGQRPSGEPAGARVDLVAPATALVSIGPGAGHFSGTGPSLAAALVGATAALVLAYHPGMGVAELMQRLETTAYHPSGTLPDPLLGYGTVDPAAAVSAVLTPAQTSPGTARDRLTVLPPAPEHPERPIALAIAGALLLVLLLTGLTLLLPRPRRRHPRRRRPGLPRRGLPRPGLPHPRR
jgi:hypothetical protein